MITRTWLSGDFLRQRLDDNRVCHDLIFHVNISCRAINLIEDEGADIACSVGRIGFRGGYCNRETVRHGRGLWDR